MHGWKEGKQRKEQVTFKIGLVDAPEIGGGSVFHFCVFGCGDVGNFHLVSSPHLSSACLSLCKDKKIPLLQVIAKG